MDSNTVKLNSPTTFYFSFILILILGTISNSGCYKPESNAKRSRESTEQKVSDSPEEKTAPEVTANEIIATLQLDSMEEPGDKAAPALEEKAVMPKKAPALEPAAAESLKPKVVQVIPVVPDKKIQAAPEIKAMEKPVAVTKPAMKKKAVAPEKKPVPKPEVVEPLKPKVVQVIPVVPDKKIQAAPEIKAMEKPVAVTQPAMKKKTVAPEKALAPKPKVVETPKPKVVPVAPDKKVMKAPEIKVMEKPTTAQPAMEKKTVAPEKAPAPKPEVVAAIKPKVKSVGFIKGAKACEECHEGEFKIWKKTKHSTSFSTAHREPKDSTKPSPRKILKKVAGAKRMKRNETCSLCHYTMEQKDSQSKPVAKSGTSCESCHGASSEWLAIHDNYGGEGIKRVDEAPTHKRARISKSRAAGFIWPIMKYEVAENCMTCHGLAHPDLSGDMLAKMLAAGHPINPDFEAVKYSQGTVRHRYTPEDITNNREMTEAERAELFVIGHAAALVSAREALSKSNEKKYTDAQNKRAENAKAALSLLNGIPEAAALMASPNRNNALKLVNAIAGKDLSGKVGSKLPAKSDYK